MSARRITTLIIVGLFSASVVMGQAGNSNREMSIEESYLQEAIEMMIIREASRGDSREQKLIALEYIRYALARGSTNPELRSTLEYLSMEGTLNKTTQSGRLINNFPDIRREAARYLGDVGNKEAVTALIRICFNDNEPMVLQEAIRSLGIIGINEDDETVHMIVWVANRFNNAMPPDELLALSTVDALDRIAEKGHGIKDPNAVQVILKIIEGSYTALVKERARRVLSNIRSYAASN